jgi:hypothetical protein
MHRRRYLATIAGVAGFGLAGCTEEDVTGGNGTVDDGAAENNDTDGQRSESESDGLGESGDDGGEESDGLGESGDDGGDEDDGRDEGANGDDGRNYDEQYPDAWAYNENQGLVLFDVSAEADRYTLTITGEVLNAGGEDYDYVQLSFGLFNDREQKVGTALANISNLAAGQTWRFEALGSPSERAATFRLEEITAF